MLPKVSVIMPVYNGARYVGDAVDSILAQTYLNYEFLIIDDGSEDMTQDTIAAYKDPRIQLIRNEKNFGLAASLNKGIALSRGAYIARMDADDISRPDRFARQVAFMDLHPEVGACGTWVEVVGEGYHQVWEYPTQPNSIHARVLFDCPMAHPTVMFNHAHLRKSRLSYDPSYPCAQDYELWSRAVHCLPLANIPEVLLIRRLHTEQIGRRQANDQQIWADKVRRRELEQLGMSPTEKQFALHEAISTWSWPRTDSFLRESEEWLCALRDANSTRPTYPEPEFSKVVGERWMAICQSVEQTLGRRFWSSSLSDVVDLGWKQNLCGHAWRGLSLLRM